MIYCRHGYAVPRIKVYIGLMKSIPAFTEWPERLGCAKLVGGANRRVLRKLLLNEAST